MGLLRVGRCLREGWRVFGRRRRFLMGIWLLVWCIEGIVVTPLAVRPEIGPLFWVTLLVSAVLYGPLYAGQQFLVLCIARDQPCGVGTASAGFARFGRILGITVAMILRIVVALGPLVLAFLLSGFVAAYSLPAFYAILLVGGAISLVFFVRICLRYGYAWVLALDKGTGVLDSMAASAELTRGSLARLLGIAIVPSLLWAPLVVLQQFIAGPLWATALTYGLSLGYSVVVLPWYVASAMVAYRVLRGEGQEQEAAPST